MLKILALEVKDEILNGEPLYTIKDENDNVLYDDVRLELKTSTIQQGTELNKVLFDKIDESFKNIIKTINNMNLNKRTQELLHNQILGIIQTIGNRSETQDIRIKNLESRMTSLENKVAKL